MPRTARDQSATGIYHVMIRVVMGTGTWGMRDKFKFTSKICKGAQRCQSPLRPEQQSRWVKAWIKGFDP